jgi:aminopeptidase YwaD
MLPEEIVKVVIDTVSGIRAKEYVSSITSFHRIQATSGLHDAIMYLKNEIAEFPDVEVKLYEYPADGKTVVSTWEAVQGWDAKSGKLYLVEPEEMLLADYAAEPISLIAHSTSTDFEGEVVYIGKGLSPEDYEGKDVKGKIVLTEGVARMVHRVACIKYGAAGLLTFVPPSSKDEIASLRRYDAIWPSGEEKDKTRFGFSLTQADGVKLKGWLEKGKTVKVKARVEANLKEGKTEVLSAVIRGEDTSKEFWLAAHICHPKPGANDNASGSGSLMEALRVISELVKEGKIPKPTYSIRFIWIPEWSGTIYFIDREKELLKRCKGMLNMDMVGADPAKSGSILFLYRTPYSLPSTLNNVVRYWLKIEAGRKDDRTQGGTMTPLPYNYESYGAGSDHFMLTDATVGIPAVMLNQNPDRFYHTSTDTIDKIDTRQMAYATRIAVLSALSLVLPKYVYEETVLTECRNEFVELMEKVRKNLSACP